MGRKIVWLNSGIIAVLGGVLLLTPSTRGGDVGYIEDFSLARDRMEALKQLIPGTEDYYYYNTLHLLNTEQFEKIPPITKLWYERFKQTQRLTEIQTRHALLTFDKSPEQSLAYLRGRLGLRFDHQKETLGVPPNLPMALNQQLIARATLQRDAIGRHGNANLRIEKGQKSATPRPPLVRASSNP